MPAGGCSAGTHGSRTSARTPDGARSRRTPGRARATAAAPAPAPPPAGASFAEGLELRAGDERLGRVVAARRLPHHADGGGAERLLQAQREGLPVLQAAGVGRGSGRVVVERADGEPGPALLRPRLDPRPSAAR